MAKGSFDVATVAQIPTLFRFASLSFGCLNFILIIRFFSLGELFSGKESGGNVGRILARAEQVLVEFVEELASASVTVCDYKLAENGMERLLGMCSVVDGRRNNSELKQVAISALTQRRLEYKAFDEERSSVLSFANSCRLLGNGMICTSIKSLLSNPRLFSRS